MKAGVCGMKRRRRRCACRVPSPAPTLHPPGYPPWPAPAANIFIGSLIFIEELADKIVQAVGPCRDSLDACLIFPSMPAVMKLNKLGSFSMSQLGEQLLPWAGCFSWSFSGRA